MHVSDDELLEVDAIVDESGAAPVLADQGSRDVVRSRQVLPVIAQAAAVAATGFAAGAVTAAVVRAVRSGGSAKPRRRARPGHQKVVSTRSFLVEVHELGPRG